MTDIRNNRNIEIIETEGPSSVFPASAVLGATLFAATKPWAQEAMVVVPAPALDERKADATETAVLAGGAASGACRPSISTPRA